MAHAERDQLLELLYTRSFIYREDPPFTLVSGRESFYYFDCKATTLTPQGLYLVGRLMFEQIAGSGAEAIGGLTLGADPIALATALEAYRNDTNITPLIVRKEPKKHGTQKWIEGNLENVQNVIVVDDVITTGGSTITAVERMRESGLAVTKALVIIDREEGGRESIEALGIPVVSLFTRSDFDRLRQSRR